MKKKTWQAGRFCWIDLGTTDTKAAKSFYTALFGWETEDMPMPDGGGSYTTARLSGEDVGGLYSLSDEMKAQNVPPHWMTYISVTSVDESTAKARKLGAEIVRSPFDIPETGRMSLIKDPTGAMVALWQIDSPHPGSGQFENVPGTLGWAELVTGNIDVAGKFYVDLFGWKPNNMNDPVPYTVFQDGETMVAGMMAKNKEMEQVPPNWSVYFSVADCDASTKKAAELGATILVPPTDIPGTGRFACFLDPQGAAFSVIATAPMK